METTTSIKRDAPDDDGHPFGTLGKEVEYAIRHDYDVKIIITSHNSKPGLGKTTLAIKLARCFDPYGWSAESKGFQDIYEYQKAYRNVPPGTVLNFEELERSADRRRAMSGSNVTLSHVWATERFRNVVTIATLPTVSMLDSRLLELSDYWINVMKRGVAHPYHVLVNDFNGKIIRERIGGRHDGETIFFNDLPNDDPDYRYLKELKARESTLEKEYFSEAEVQKKLERARREARKEVRDTFIRTLRDRGWELAEIGDLEPVDLTPSGVHRVLNPQNST